MAYEFREGKIVARSIEYSVAYHCNLRCSGCSHLSPYAENRFPEPESFAADLKRLSNVLHVDVMRLLGGEPLLNPCINQFIQIAKDSGMADCVMVTTNGCLLHRMNDDFWRGVDLVLVSLYPGISIRASFSYLLERARKFNTKLWFQTISTFRTTTVTCPHEKDVITRMIFRTCKDVHVHHCHMIYEGRLFKCPVPPFLPQYLSRMGMRYDPAVDGLDLHAQQTLYEPLNSFLASTEPMEACRYCLGDLGKEFPHHQLEPDMVEAPGRERIAWSSHLDRSKFTRALLHCCQGKISSSIGKSWSERQ